MYHRKSVPVQWTQPEFPHKTHRVVRPSCWLLWITVIYLKHRCQETAQAMVVEEGIRTTTFRAKGAKILIWQSPVSWLEWSSMVTKPCRGHQIWRCSQGWFPLVHLWYISIWLTPQKTEQSLHNQNVHTVWRPSLCTATQALRRSSISSQSTIKVGEIGNNFKNKSLLLYFQNKT